MGHVGGARPGQFFHADFDGLLTPQPVQMLREGDWDMWVVFALILLNQAGVPVFAAPALLGVGALVWTGDLSLGFAMAAAVAAAFAGVAGIGLGRFVVRTAATAAIWAGTWIGIGYLLASTTWSGGSGSLLFGVIVAVSVIASLSVAIRPAARALVALARRRAGLTARSSDADDVIGNRKSTC
jgi:membrane protein DedA with SNARE-associated domain